MLSNLQLGAVSRNSAKLNLAQFARRGCKQYLHDSCIHLNITLIFIISLAFLTLINLMKTLCDTPAHANILYFSGLVILGCLGVAYIHPVFSVLKICDVRQKNRWALLSWNLKSYFIFLSFLTTALFQSRPMKLWNIYFTKIRLS